MATIELNDSDLVLARLVADKRNEMNTGRGDAPAYARNSDRMEDNTVAMYASTRCELATAKAFNRYWHASWWPATHHHLHKHEPDVGVNIEVKRIRSPHNPLLVKEDYVTLDRVIVPSVCTHRPRQPGRRHRLHPSTPSMGHRHTRRLGQLRITPAGITTTTHRDLKTNDYVRVPQAMPHLWCPIPTVVLPRPQTQDTTIEVTSTQSKETIPVRRKL
jgi:hypothetical protein